MTVHDNRIFGAPRVRQRLGKLTLGAIFAAALAVSSLSIVPGKALGTSSDDGITAAIGKALFKRVWVPAPSSTHSNDGLGPLFNGRSCAQCHSAAGGGRLVVDRAGQLADRGAVVRLSTNRGTGDPIYGAQLQTRAVPGLNAEASVRITFETHTEVFDDGSPITLRRPVIKVEGLADGALSKATEATLILAPSLVTAARIAKVEATSNTFGLKGTAASLEEMTSLAFMRDLGLSTARFPAVAGDCTSRQSACLSAPHGASEGGAEINADIIAHIVSYLTTLDGEDAPKSEEPRGAVLFGALGCASCHTPTMRGRDGQTVTLYSDLALHPLGDALAGLKESAGQARDVWRTAPLVHLETRLKAGATLLHDGRAQTVAEAILWHGGAADGARSQYKALSKDDRGALERYLLSR